MGNSFTFLLKSSVIRTLIIGSRGWKGPERWHGVWLPLPHNSDPPVGILTVWNRPHPQQSQRPWNPGLQPPLAADLGFELPCFLYTWRMWTRPYVPNYSRPAQTPPLKGGMYDSNFITRKFWKNRKLKSSSTVYLNLLYMESIYQDGLISFWVGFLASAALELPTSGSHPKSLLLVLNWTEHLTLAPDIGWPKQMD